MQQSYENGLNIAEMRTQSTSQIKQTTKSIYQNEVLNPNLTATQLQQQ